MIFFLETCPILTFSDFPTYNRKSYQIELLPTRQCIRDPYPVLIIGRRSNLLMKA
jgi:hypothetical protein